MMRALVIVALLCATLAAQATDGQLELDVRVVSVRPGGIAVIDRGARDGVEEGDFVYFRLRNGNERRGRVARVDERNAQVRMAGGT